MRVHRAKMNNRGVRKMGRLAERGAFVSMARTRVE